MASIYDAHPLSIDTTRAIGILPSTSPDNDDIIFCQLEVIKYSCTSYRALSYVWGDSSAQEVVLIDGVPITIRMNL